MGSFDEPARETRAETAGETPAVQYRPRPAGSLRLRPAGGRIVQSGFTGETEARAEQIEPGRVLR
jgi:hypothetical protein